MSNHPAWWQQSVFYQIYPRSFMDSNNDGIGDLLGITNRLDYLVELGIEAIWISPFYVSPMDDFGYDIADHCRIHPMFGTMGDFDQLLKAVHQRGLRLVLDFVPNHTSNQHPWFLESRSSRESARRDWYIWADADDDGAPPNNWESIFGGSAWQWDEHTGQYYLHSFLTEQPDLNWRNPAVVEAMENILRFWLDKGVDGFRFDAVMCCVKHAGLPDNPPLPQDSPMAAFGFNLDPVYTMNQPELHVILQRFRKVFDSYPGDRVMIGETWLFELPTLMSYYGSELDEFHMPFNFVSTMMDWDAPAHKQFITAYFDALPDNAMPNFVFGNHDVHRLATRYGYHNHRSVAMLLLTIRGVPTVYNGDELGMQDTYIPPERRQDPWGMGDSELDVGRDPERTPMQWDASPNAGFSAGGVQTWLPVASNYKAVNVAVQSGDPNSTLNFYKTLLNLRKTLPALTLGDFAFIEGVPDEVMAYRRSHMRQTIAVLINFSDTAQQIDLSAQASKATVHLSSTLDRKNVSDMATISLAANEALLIELST